MTCVGAFLTPGYIVQAESIAAEQKRKAAENSKLVSAMSWWVLAVHRLNFGDEC